MLYSHCSHQAPNGLQVAYEVNVRDLIEQFWNCHFVVLNFGGFDQVAEAVFVALE